MPSTVGVPPATSSLLMVSSSSGAATQSMIGVFRGEGVSPAVASSCTGARCRIVCEPEKYDARTPVVVAFWSTPTNAPLNQPFGIRSNCQPPRGRSFSWLAVIARDQGKLGIPSVLSGRPGVGIRLRVLAHLVAVECSEVGVVPFGVRSIVAPAALLARAARVAALQSAAQVPAAPRAVAHRFLRKMALPFGAFGETNVMHFLASFANPVARRIARRKARTFVTFIRRRLT